MLQDIQENIEKLIAAYEKERGRADALEAELEKCRTQLGAAQIKVKVLEDKVDKLGLRNVFSSEGTDNKEAKAQIDKLIKRIDACLEML